ncbi:cyclohexanone monooxygenase [Panacagrimonas perspica]|uniref:Cyclohexanone monooxygenase n=1 Tax=Panacagrimonas perspica TaxID=381431 RepID=A0A4R7PEI1_9GAMM|nr:NAD(P)/FAD-dependent oxidoreductase [Panacagrimonas perspica]TDU32614.1 cyclohexanone monooxygenase [Panacagrimonas perspica]THD05503.1 cyclohexanone monooxygenase [Panacagrimonas perspica]
MNDTPSEEVALVDAVVVGAGFAGLYMLHRLRQQGLTATVLERGSGVGGTWFWNRYPGARCDVESLEYSYKFDEALQSEWAWSERYATQPEILRYIEHVVERFDLRRNIRFDSNVISADYSARSRRWNITIEGGKRYEARYFIAATGCLSQPNEPKYPGQESFGGDIHYTSRWPQQGVDFTGKRVAVIGTGSSGIQSIPLIAAQAAHLTVFQRTPNFSVPACNRPLQPDEVAKTKIEYGRFREHNLEQPFAFNLFVNPRNLADASPAEREREFERRWSAFGGLQFLGAFQDVFTDPTANRAAQEFIRGKIRSIVQDPRKAELLMPSDHAVGCKRLCSDSGYFETYNRPNVDLVDIRAEPIESFVQNGVRVAGRVVEVDAIVYATGFDAMTGALSRIRIQGREGRRLTDEWAQGAQTYLGLMSAGFPNFFMVTGPGSPSVLTNMVMAIEDHVDWISNCIAFLDAEGIHTIETPGERQNEWMRDVSAIAEATQFSGCNSWYYGSNIPGKPRVFTIYVGFADYRKKIGQIAARQYDSFTLERETAVA